MDFAKELFSAVSDRKCGRRWRRAVATTSSEGGMPGADGSEPGAEGVPHELGEDGGQILNQALRDEAGLNEEMIGVDLVLHGVAIVEGFGMKILVTVSPAQRFRLLHPEVIRERTDNAHRLLEAVFDFEAQAVETNDLEGA